MKELTKEIIRSMPLGYMLPEPYNSYANDEGFMNWEALEMCYPGRGDILVTILEDMFGNGFSGAISWKMAVATGEIDLSSLSGRVGIKGQTGPVGPNI